MQIPKIKLPNKGILLGLGSVLSFAGGLSIGYFVDYKKSKDILEEKIAAEYHALYIEEVEEARQHYAKLYKHDEFSTPTKLVEELVVENEEEVAAYLEAVVGLGYAISAEESSERYAEESSESDNEVAHNIFTDAPTEDEWDYDIELEERDDLYPYIIHVDEYMLNETEFNQDSLTYFVNDDVLLDSKDVVVRNQEEVVGVGNLLFGHGSKDPKVVYIRNVKMSLEVEITASEGSYSKDVLGFDDSLQHSHQRPKKKFRGYDE